MVDSLFNLCLDYVAWNIGLVESFSGFPDLIAQKIFHAVEARGQLELKNPTLLRQILFTFTSAYNDVLTDVNIEGEHLFLAECLDLLMLFSHLRALNVSSCCLGNEHELLFHISTLESLEVLVLRDNDLTDEGIRKLTAPIRVKKTGPLCLKTLDLSENAEVTVQSIKFLRVFSALTLLNLSSTAVHSPLHRQIAPELQEYARGRSLVVVLTTMMPEEMRAKVKAMTEVKTRGWGSEMITAWRQESRHRCQTSGAVDDSSSTMAKRFYGTKKKTVQLKTQRGSSSKAEKTKDTRSFSLILIHASLVPSSAPRVVPSWHGASPVSVSFATTAEPRPSKTTECLLPTASACSLVHRREKKKLSTSPDVIQTTKILNNVRSASPNSSSHTFKDAHKLSEQDSSKVITSQGFRDSNSAIRGVNLFSNSQRTGTGCDQTSVRPKCLNMRPASGSVVDGQEKRSVHDMSKGKRGQEGDLSRESTQRKRRCVERNFGDDDLSLLCQYGYCGK